MAAVSWGYHNPPRKTAAEKRAERKHDELCEALRKAVDATDSGQPDQVVAAFKATAAELKAKPHELCDAFWKLDSQPGLFPGYGYGRDTGWHSKLRVCRNTPSAGRALFSLFK